MNIKQTMFIFVLISSIVMGCFALTTTVNATCGGVETSIINCDQNPVGTCSDGSTPVDSKCADGVEYTAPEVKVVGDTGIWGILLLAINILTAGIGVAAVGGILYGSILYASAGGSPDGVKKAKDIIKNVVIGLVAYALMYSLLNFLIPGGIFL